MEARAGMSRYNLRFRLSSGELPTGNLTACCRRCAREPAPGCQSCAGAYRNAAQGLCGCSADGSDAQAWMGAALCRPGAAADCCEAIAWC